ncbi:alpha/beta hydrolase, partial [Nocardia gipuzkoensis]|uniref:alpha/beta hydrolase n=1 Tax=Nocardia gipuzkoensis TaxID=2749991 RepID=UPI00237D3389
CWISRPRCWVAPHGTKRAKVQADNWRAEWLWHGDVPDPRHTQRAALLYFHGGGYICRGLNTHRRLVAKIARASRIPAFNVDYRQLPHAHITDTLDDAVEAYLDLLEHGFRAERIIVSGDSAGGGLAFGLALATRERGLPMPAAISAIAPWADFDATQRNIHPNRHRDAYLPARGMDIIARHGFAVDGRLDPAWSPVNHDFTGLPPVLIQVGSTEYLRPDAQALAGRCAQAQVPARLQIWDRAPHVPHAAADLLRDAPRRHRPPRGIPPPRHRGHTPPPTNSDDQYDKVPPTSSGNRRSPVPVEHGNTTSARRHGRGSGVKPTREVIRRSVADWGARA